MTDTPTVILGVGASISAYKGIEVLRCLSKAGASVHVAPTHDSLNFVGLSTWQSLSSNEVCITPFERSTQIGHVSLAEQAKALVIVGASADLIAKLRIGLASDMLTLLALNATCPLFIAPAMHPTMWENPATQENVTILKKRGWIFIGPDSGILADGQHGVGRLTDPQVIAQTVLEHCAQKENSNHHGLDRGFWSSISVLVSAGGTREPWDEVRFLGNRSSGRQGCAIAAIAQDAGAKVDLVACNVEEGLYPSSVRIHKAQTAQELLMKMTSLSKEAKIIIQCAAVADFRPAKAMSGKITRHEMNNPVLDLEPTPDILAFLIKERKRNQMIIGFAAQTGDEKSVIQAGVIKAKRKGTDLLAVNQVGDKIGFGNVKNRLHLVDKNGNIVNQIAGTKEETALGLLAQIENDYKKLVRICKKEHQ